MKVRKFWKRIWLSIVACMMLSGNIWGIEYTQKDFNSYVNRVKNINQELGQKVYNDLDPVLGEIKIGNSNLFGLLRQTKTLNTKIRVYNEGDALLNELSNRTNNNSLSEIIERKKDLEDSYGDNKASYYKHAGSLEKIFKNNALNIYESAKVAAQISEVVYNPMKKIKALEGIGDTVKAGSETFKLVNAALGLSNLMEQTFKIATNPNGFNINELSKSIDKIDGYINENMIKDKGLKTLDIMSNLVVNLDNIRSLNKQIKAVNNIDNNTLSTSWKNNIIKTLNNDMYSSFFSITTNLLGSVKGNDLVEEIADVLSTAENTFNLFAKNTNDAIYDTLDDVNINSIEKNSEMDSLLAVNKDGFEVGKEILVKNNENLNTLIQKDKEVKEKIKEINEDTQTLADKNAELESLQNNNGQIDTSKVANLQAAQDLINKNSGKPFSEWSSHDQVDMGIIAKNLGVATGQDGIVKKGQFFEALFKIKGIDYLTEKYATATIDYNDLQANIDALNAEIDKLQKSIDDNKAALSGLETEKNNLMNSIVDTTTNDVNDDNKIALVQTFSSTIAEPKDWRGFMTANIETKSDGTLRYWGGSFSSEAIVLQYGANNFTETINGKIDEEVAWGHGQNTGTDNTKHFSITDSDAKQSSPYNSNIKTLEYEKTLSNGNTLKIQTDDHYDYTVWGSWSQTGGLITQENGGNGIDHMAMHNNWIAGQPTENLPTQGSATYTGKVAGHYYEGGVGSTYGEALNGTMSMTVNFSNTSVVAGALNIKKASDNSAFATATMDNMQISRTSNAFTGRLIGTDIAAPTSYNNKINGQFYGPNAEEVGGNWTIEKTDGKHASGVFAGEK